MMRHDREPPLRNSVVRRELERMSDWELERGLASSEAFDQDRRIMADRLLGERYAWTERGVAFWVLVFSALVSGVGALVLM